MSAEQPPLHAEELLRTLARHEVEYVLIGGVAVQAYGHVRTTLDLDVIAAWTHENLHRLAAALGELKARLRGVDAELLGIDLSDPKQLHEGGNFLMRTSAGDLDVFAVDQTAGAPRTYEQLRERAVPVEVFGVRLLVAHPEDLIRMKVAAAGLRDRPATKREQDRQDVAVLEQLRSRAREPGIDPTPPDASAERNSPPRRTRERDPGREGPSLGR